MLETGESTWPGGMSLVVELQGYRTRPAKHWGDDRCQAWPGQQKTNKHMAFEQTQSEHELRHRSRRMNCPFVV